MGYPVKINFYNTLINRAIIDKSYEHVFNVSKAFKINTIKTYHDLYLQFDVFLLACVFETLRRESINSTELNPSYYLSTPGYSWDAMLRFTDVSLKLISDIEKYQSIESTINGAVSMIYENMLKLTKYS